MGAGTVRPSLRAPRSRSTRDFTGKAAWIRARARWIERARAARRTRRCPNPLCVVRSSSGSNRPVLEPGAAMEPRRLRSTKSISWNASSSRDMRAATTHGPAYQSAGRMPSDGYCEGSARKSAGCAPFVVIPPEPVLEFIVLKVRWSKRGPCSSTTVLKPRSQAHAQ